MHRTRVPLRDWFWAAYLVTMHTLGFSAWQLQRQVGLGRYETAWAILQDALAMSRPFAPQAQTSSEGVMVVLS